MSPPTPPGTPDDSVEGAPGASPDDDAGLRRRLEQFIPDIVRRTVIGGIGAAFATEEGIRKLASEISLPKDVVNFLLQQASNSKDEVLRVVAKEVRGFLESANLSHEIAKLLTQLSLEVKTEVRFIPNDEAVGGVKPDMKRQMVLKRSGKIVDEG
jgi:hypothetical protein